MNIERAIEILQHKNYLDLNLETPDIIQALILGIEALKELQVARQYLYAGVNLLLPSETKD